MSTYILGDAAILVTGMVDLTRAEHGHTRARLLDPVPAAPARPTRPGWRTVVRRRTIAADRASVRPTWSASSRVATFPTSRYATDTSRPLIRGRFRLRHANDRGQGFESPLAPKRFCGSSATFSAVRQFAARTLSPSGE